MRDWLSVVRRLADRLPTVDRSAAARATVLAAAVLVTFLLLQGAVTAALTSGTQPMLAVDSVPTEPSDVAWDDAPNRTVELSKQRMAIPIGGGSVDEMDVQAMTNDSHVAFRLSWEDPTNDTSLSEPRAYSDAAAVMFHSGSTPPITMGAASTPVNIWYWRASWQYGAEDAPWTGSMYAYPHPDNETRPGMAVGNPLSKNDYQQFAQNYYAKGYGSLSHAPVQPVHASAERTDDGWSVTFVRERGTNGTYDAAFSDDEPMYLAFAVWNGSADEVNGKKSITLQFTRLDPANASLAAADTGGGGDDGSDPDGGGAGGSAGALPTSVGPWIVALISATTAAWLVSYRRMEQ